MRRFDAVWSVVVMAGLLGGCGPGTPDGAAERTRGAPLALGNGTVDSYAEFDASGTPEAIGVAFSGQAFEDLPQQPSDGHRCYDADADERIDLETECSAWHELVLPLPSEAARHPDIPFKWALVNWNAHGHIPPGVWDVPHFDVHFYMERIEKIFSLKRGPCGPEFLRCDQYEAATQPVPANYMHPDYEDVGAAAPAMGNHLPALRPPPPPCRGRQGTWTFSAGGRAASPISLLGARVRTAGPMTAPPNHLRTEASMLKPPADRTPAPTRLVSAERSVCSVLAATDTQLCETYAEAMVLLFREILAQETMRRRVRA